VPGFFVLKASSDLLLILSMKDIVLALPADYPEIVDVWEASVRATHHFLSEEHIQFFKPLIPQYLGSVQLYCVRNEEDSIQGFLGVAEGNIEMLFLHPLSIGKGIGKRLLQFAMQNLKAIKVDVNEQNEQAVGFYKRNGFKIVSRSEKDGLGMPFPILHMEL
jgi:putative acetyltransferase